MTFKSLAVAATVFLTALGPAASFAQEKSIRAPGAAPQARQAAPPRNFGRPPAYAPRGGNRPAFVQQGMPRPAPSVRYAPRQNLRPVGPNYASPRFTPPVRATGPAYRIAPRFLGHPQRRFWRGRWIWLGAPLVGFAYDPCWQRLWTDWGWGWFYTCVYDPNYPY